MLLGCIGDDFTGSSDLGLTLAREGLRTVQYCGVPSRDADMDVDAGIVALKSRSCPPQEAVAESLKALSWLRRQGCQKFFFKYCSTFDSTPQGNIGPVIDALMTALDTDRAIVCPAFPATGRTLFNGHLFVNDRLLNESGMQNHPLTPMVDADIRRWLARQSQRRVGHVAYQEVTAGSAAVTAALDREVAAGRPIVVVDAVFETDLRTIGHAAAHTTLITGGSGVALGLPATLPKTVSCDSGTQDWQGSRRPGVVLSGSCSKATRDQVSVYAASHPALELKPEQVISGEQSPTAIADWLIEHLDEAPMAYSTADPNSVKAIQAAYGQAETADAIEACFAAIAVRLADGGVGRIVAAGGETSGAVTAALGVGALRIGPEIAPGVPALRAVDSDLVLALKSGNFGGLNFFERAMRALDERP